jgi:hypothetical protein
VRGPVYPYAMRILPLVLASAVLSVVFVGAGCGGKVVIDTGEGGSGQGGSASSGGTTTTNTTTSGSMTSGVTSGGSMTSGVTSGGGGNITTNCEAFCKVATSNGCVGKSCFESCYVTSEQPPCGASFALWIDCIVKNADAIMGCSMPPACVDYESKYLACSQGGDCGPQSCVADDTGGCACVAKCSTGEYEASCQPSANGGSVCSCFINGMIVGECDNPSLSCDVSGSCCGDIFFEKPGGGDPGP